VVNLIISISIEQSIGGSVSPTLRLVIEKLASKVRPAVLKARKAKAPEPVEAPKAASLKSSKVSCAPDKPAKAPAAAAPAPVAEADDHSVADRVVRVCVLVILELVMMTPRCS